MKKKTTVQTMKRARELRKLNAILDLDGVSESALKEIQVKNRRFRRFIVTMVASMGTLTGVGIMVAMAETGHDPGSFTSWFFGAFMGVMAGFVGGMVLALSSYVLFEGVRGALNWRAENLEESLVPSEASGGDQLLVHARNLLSALDYPELDSYHQDIEPVLASLPQLGAMMGTVAEYQNQGVPVPKDVQSAIDESLTAVASVAGVARREMDRVDAERAERVVRLQMLGMKELDGSLDPEVFTRAAVLANMVEQVRTDTIKRLDAQQIEA